MIIINRFEGDIAVVEHGEKFYNIPRAWLPTGCKQGDMVVLKLVVEEREKFELTNDDKYAIILAKKVARTFLCDPQIKPVQVIGIGNALYALERMPLVTPGAYIQFGLTYREGTPEQNEMRYINFTISDFHFNITVGGVAFDSCVGSDTFYEPGWYIQIGGYSEAECDLDLLELKIGLYLGLGAEITVDDKSEIDYK